MRLRRHVAIQRKFTNPRGERRFQAEAVDILHPYFEQQRQHVVVVGGYYRETGDFFCTRLTPLRRIPHTGRAEETAVAFSIRTKPLLFATDPGEQLLTGKCGLSTLAGIDLTRMNIEGISRDFRLGLGC